MESEANIKKLDQTVTPLIVESPQKQKLWNSLSDGQRRLFASLIAGGVVVGVAWLIIWLVDRKVKKYRANLEENKAFGADKHATWAKQFKQGFDNDGWWGTDVPLVRQTMRAIPSKEDFKKVQDSYRVLYQGANLIADLSDELTKTEFEEMLAIKNSKPEKAKGASSVKIYDPTGWAKRIHAAINYNWFAFIPGTDEDAIKAVFMEIPTQRAFYATATVYLKLYGNHLWDDLDGDLNWSMDWRALLKKKPKK
ncbi:hypothetical protein [Fluviicola sp.]|uniref:hypothetical protein n=1 Tax=Fluviicola sp. TaxID=1917219 RepID=UPI0031CF9690